MKQSERSKALKSMQESVTEQTYMMTPHALLEMRNDRLDVVDVESAILTGRIERVFEDDPRGRRYEVVGKACDLATEIGVVTRFPGTMLIITVYEKKR